MTHTYLLSGMTCSGCEAKVISDLSKVKNVTKVEVSKEQKRAIIMMTKHVELEILQKALGGNDSKYQIALPNALPHNELVKDCCSTEKKENIAEQNNHSNIQGKFYCPMHCEDDKTYDKAGDCPVCGMHLVQEATTVQNVQFTCPMHPEIITNAPGNCPICGMI